MWRNNTFDVRTSFDGDAEKLARPLPILSYASR